MSVPDPRDALQCPGPAHSPAPLAQKGKKGEEQYHIKEGSSEMFPSSKINLPCYFTVEYQNIKRNASGSSEIPAFYSVRFTEGKILHPAFGTMENRIIQEKIVQALVTLLLGIFRQFPSQI